MSGKIIKLSRNTDQAPINALSTQSVAFSHYNNISAQLPIDPKSGELVIGDIKAQAEQCFANIKSIVESIEHVMDDVVKVNIYLKNIDHVDAVNEVMAMFFTEYFPTKTVSAVAELPNSDALIQIDALISNGEGTQPQEPCPLIKQARNCDSVTKSATSTHSVAFSHYNNLSAQLPVDPTTGTLVEGGVKAQTAQCLRNLKTVLESIDVPFDDIVKVGIQVTDLADIELVNEVYMTFFPDSAIARSVAYVPARSITQAAGLPMNALVQIDAVISHGDGTPPQEVEDRHGIVIRANNTDLAPISELSTQTVAFSHYNHISAQLPVDVQTGHLVEGNTGVQAKQCLTHIKSIVESIGHEMDDLVKVNIQLTNMADLHMVDEVYTTFFNGNLPARTVIGVEKVASGALIQIDAVVSNAEGTPPKK
ncbi:endoribonuclease, L-PSP domain [Vibrio orientalis CIP 102891 = ATCC 33934]|uniref:Endoribonuclease L-PSP n=1 Tax=Vibrio orientalis CIP 102891 = ATCC 33934 TaxID=675816 RepID=C9QE89_VIBOR|nr:RidA family protein [Vibrio orientalis]EEX94270.1 endoribonuclease L-PSP [Vibrio orientalis CIP 102891 = ATCC 33934]EGU54185.1 endoribonuclease, L-PSP domain [Vibrio orientalis CIP 102891 = ATCC 33934]